MEEPGLGGEEASTATKAVIFIAGASLLVVAAIMTLVATRVMGFVMRLASSGSEPKAGAKGKKGAAAVPPPEQPQAQHHAKHQGPDLKTLIKQSKKQAAGPKGPKEEHAVHHHLFINGLPGHGDAVHSLSWSIDGTKIVTACEDMNVRVYSLGSDVSNRDPKFKRIACNRTPIGAGFADARCETVSAVMRGIPDTVMSLFVPGSGKPEVLPSGQVKKIDGADVAIAWTAENVHGREAVLVARGIAPSEHQLTGRRPGLVVSLSTKKDCRVYSVQGNELATLEIASLGNHDLAVSIDGRFISVACFTSEVKIWEVKCDKNTGVVTGVYKAMELKGHKKKVMSVALSHDNKRAVTVSQDGTLRVWNIDVRYALAEDPKTVLTIAMPLSGGRCYQRLAMGPGGIIAASVDGLVHLLDGTNGSLLDAIPDAHDGGVSELHWCPTKLRLPGVAEPVAVLATCGRDKRVRLWRAPL
ncbi:hypothetical protein FOA52_014700 [Chlamydomonas sp. UWO 241]|nr:hypothetical protein FOA52_014700 [Chlamydomonas sp. UWO 241]